ncbi:Peptidase A1 domain-containing protein [Aphelenchoides bicaudatus]|nr:Peptidase A1 domain-containing protein [Aphelenchoides bicaudatus]
MVELKLTAILLALSCGFGHAIWGEYQILAFIGQPSFPYLLMLDISTSDIWMYSDDCKNCPQSSRLNHNLTSPNNLDASFKLDFTTKDNDQSGTIEGSLTTDYMLLVPDIHPIKDTKQHKIALITKITGADETVDPYDSKLDGRIGLGLNKNSQTSTVDLLFGNYDKLLCLLQAQNGFVDTMLTLGQKMLDKEVKYTKITSATVVDQNNGLWTVPLTSYTFGKYGATRNFKAQLSTTTSYISVNPDLYEKVLDVLEAYEENNNMLMDCSAKSQAPNLNLKIGGNTFTISPDTYIVDGPNASECIVKIRQVEDADDYFVLGTTFLDSFSFCLNYDTNTIDFLNVTGLK